MNVLITQHCIRDEKYGVRDILNHDYVHYLSRFGIHVIPVPNVPAALPSFLSHVAVHGIILSGGNNVSPEMYGGKTPVKDVSQERDALETKLFDHAIKKKIPVLGICRGMQFINVYFGGKLVQNIRKECGTCVSHRASLHSVKLLSGEATRCLKAASVRVNSYHAQGVHLKTLSPELEFFAVTEDDGIVEGLYHPRFPAAGIQWHPERKSPDVKANARILKAFLQRKLFWERT